MISPEEEMMYAEIIQWSLIWSSAYQKAVNKLIEANLRFVVSVAKQYQHQWLPLSDLINDWNVWLIKAAQRFDPYKMI